MRMEGPRGSHRGTRRLDHVADRSRGPGLARHPAAPRRGRRLPRRPLGQPGGRRPPPGSPAPRAAPGANRGSAHPGHFAPAPDPERLRAEAVLGIAQHDNGWWEWDAAPRLREADGLPLGLAEVVKNQREGMDRWRRGVPRLREAHPYTALLIGCHAYWLHAPQVGTGMDPAFCHPLYAKTAPAALAGEE